MKHQEILQFSSRPAARPILERRPANKIVFVLLALICLLVVAFNTAQAQARPKVLVITSDENVRANAGEKALGLEINGNVVKEFNSSDANEKYDVVVDQTELSNGQPAPAGFFSGYDIVVLSAVFADIDEADRTAITDAVLTKKSNVFVFFVDSCSPCSSANATWFLDLIDQNAQSFTPGQGAEVTGYLDFPLNTTSQYATSLEFTGHPWRLLQALYKSTHGLYPL